MSDISPVPSDKISERAHKIWQARGCPPDTSAEDWQNAKRELELERKFLLPGLWYACKRYMKWYKKPGEVKAPSKNEHAKIITIGTISILGLVTTVFNETIKHQLNPLEQDKFAWEKFQADVEQMPEDKRVSAQVQSLLNKEDSRSPLVVAALYKNEEQVRKAFDESARALLSRPIPAFHLGPVEFADQAMADHCQKLGRAQINFAKRLADESTKKGQRYKIDLAVEQGRLALDLLSRGYGTNLGEQDHQYVADAKSIYAYILAERADKNDLKMAENYYLQAIEGLTPFNKSLGIELSEAMNGLADLYVQDHRLDEAEALYIKALKAGGCNIDSNTLWCRTIKRNLIVNVYLEQKTQDMNNLVSQLTELDQLAYLDKQEGRAIAKANLAYGYLMLAQSLKSQDQNSYQKALQQAKQTYIEADNIYHGLDAKEHRTGDDLTDSKAYAELRKSLALFDPKIKVANEAQAVVAAPVAFRKIQKQTRSHKKNH